MSDVSWSRKLHRTHPRLSFFLSFFSVKDWLQWPDIWRWNSGRRMYEIDVAYYGSSVLATVTTWLLLPATLLRVPGILLLGIATYLIAGLLGPLNKAEECIHRDLLHNKKASVSHLAIFTVVKFLWMGSPGFVLGVLLTLLKQFIR